MRCRCTRTRSRACGRRLAAQSPRLPWYRRRRRARFERTRAAAAGRARPHSPRRARRRGRARARRRERPGLGTARAHSIAGATKRFCDHCGGFLVLTRVRTIPVAAVAALAAALVSTAVALVFFYAPVDSDQGFSQKIFYFHVPIALTAYACFGWGALKAFLHLWKRTPGADLESYVAIHLGVIFGVLTLLTGSIWAKISWGHWWLWSEDQLVLFLVLFMFYSAYFMLRFSIPDGPGRANMSAVYALFGVVLIPVSWLAIHLSQLLIHPIVFT